MMTVYGLVVWVFARELMSIYLDNPETIEAGVTLIRIVSIAFPAVGAFLMLENIHMGVGLNKPTMFISVIHSLLFLTPILIQAQAL